MQAQDSSWNFGSYRVLTHLNRQCVMRNESFLASLQELHVLWEQTLSCLEKADGPTIAKSILHFAYFWYNFMPLARGTAAAGYIFILSMFLAAGMPVTGSIPKASARHFAHTPKLVQTQDI